MKWFSPELICLAWLSLAWVSPSAAAAQASSAKVHRGKYLVVEAAHCGDCHTPMNDKGEPVTEKWMQGTVLMFKPTVTMPWADTSANIAGLPGWSTQDAVTFFMTGKYKGQEPKPPMPEYHLTRRDAEAVVAYLQSLTPAK
jgi:fructose 5-dehydrogenase cytochrome subunit